MKRFAILLPVLLVACGQPGPSAPPKTFTLAVKPAENFKAVSINAESFQLKQSRSYPLIDAWVYSLPSESADSTSGRWTKRFEVNRFKKVNAEEIFSQMQGAVPPTDMVQADNASNTVCYVTSREEGKLKEATIWKYADTSRGLTYANGLQWQFPDGPAFSSFMRDEFPRTCTAMRSIDLVTPPKL